MIKIKISPEQPILLFVRIKGSKGMREVRALLDTGSQYSLISVQDARLLGYNAYYDAESFPGQGTLAVGQVVSMEVDNIVLEEVSVGDLIARNVKTLCYSLTRLAGVDAILGLSFLKNFKTTIDYKAGFLTLEPI